MKVLMWALFVSVVALPVFAQYEMITAPAGTPRPASFGTVDEGAVSVSFAAFTPTSSGQAYSDGGASRFNPNGPGVFVASVSLPDGVLITGIALMACDTADPGDVLLELYVRQPAAVIPLVGVGTPPGTPGCGNFYFQVPPGTEPVVNNGDNAYYFVAVTSEASDATALTGARVFYRRQVSPPPLTARFADVPTTHPFFKFVEALAASGITAGCGGGNFCPNSSVTRGQMAVFLASALGLHWPALE